MNKKKTNQEKVIQKSYNEMLTINFKLSKTLFDTFYNAYNETRPLRSKLKLQHREYYYTLIRVARNQIIKKQKEAPGSLKPGAVKISVNSVMLSKKMSTTSRTIRNYNKILLKLGLINKVFHGVNRNYEIYFNPFLMFYTELNNPEKLPKELQNSQALSELNSLLLRKRFPQLTELNRHSNKQINNAEHSNQNDIADNSNANTENRLYSSPLSGIYSISDLDAMLSRSYRFECNDTICSDTGFADASCKNAEIDQSNVVPGDQKPLRSSTPNSAAPPQADDARDNSSTASVIEPMSAEADDSKKNKVFRIEKINQKTIRQQLKLQSLDDLRIVYAQILYNFALDRIPTWKERVYDDTAGEVILYISETYFGHCKSKAQMSRELELFERAVETAARFIRKKLLSGKWAQMWQMPGTWFNENYNKGFRQQLRYLKEKREKAYKQNLNKQRLNVNQKLNEILVEYFSTDYDNYYQLLARVRNTIPSREKQFKYCIKNKIQEVSNHFKNSKIA
ncbi:MAG: hypothetical protein PF448_06270 [Bacteroidales bacterium]|jgi:hypothetical protein|nr:hypothetical protein [Bacteroidales bacterium]